MGPRQVQRYSSYHGTPTLLRHRKSTRAIGSARRHVSGGRPPAELATSQMPLCATESAWLLGLGFAALLVQTILSLKSGQSCLEALRGCYGRRQQKRGGTNRENRLVLVDDNFIDYPFAGLELIAFLQATRPSDQAVSDASRRADPPSSREFCCSPIAEAPKPEAVFPAPGGISSSTLNLRGSHAPLLPDEISRRAASFPPAPCGG